MNFACSRKMIGTSCLVTNPLNCCFQSCDMWCISKADKSLIKR